ncbi:MAG: PfkB family carbohydrate kinase [Lachnospiraceae bacterium]|jgi:sugar/nucleoside kinase (ribokinase family)|nr:PfkB family carbohydrate kinase [Lachnospiraceae bacterium]MCI1329000.1 PfkB family carbohydrate kinase [Lachnospiraceae bacterium]
MKHDIMLIGPACRDVNIDFDGTVDRGIGGAVYFCSFAARAVGADVMNAVKINPDDTDVRDAFEEDADHIRILPSRLTTKMKNVYTTPTRETRDASCEAQSDPILPGEIPDAPCTIFHLAGLLYGDFPDELIPFLAGRGLLSADIQGFLRHNDGGPMHFRDWKQKTALMKYFHFLKTDAAEAEILTGSSDRRQAAEIMHGMGAKEIVITHNEEVLAYDGDQFYTCPIRARNLSGRTGRGDTTMGVYLACRAKGSPIRDALLTATAAVSLKMETPGPIRADAAAIRSYIRDFYPDAL